MEPVDVVVLAGGRGERFGGDKLSHPIRGKPLLRRVVATALEALPGRVIVATRPERREKVEGLVRGLGAVVVEDSAPCEGPLAGIVTGCRTSTAKAVIVVPGDSLWLTPVALRSLAEYAQTLQAPVISPLWDGRGVIALLHTYASRELCGCVERACRAKARLGGARPSDVHRCSPRVGLVGSTRLAGSPLAYTTLNRPEDLDNPPSPERPTGAIEVYQGQPSLFEEALEALEGGEAKASGIFLAEARHWAGAGQRMLALHAAQDSCLAGAHVAKGLVAELRAALGLPPRRRSSC